MNDSEVGHFTKDCIPRLKVLVKKRWSEGNPICVPDPPIKMPEWISELIIKEWREHND